MPKRLAEKEIFKTKLFTIKDITLQFGKNKKVTYQILEKRDTALIVPITNDGKLLLVREYFTAIDEYQLSLPKGRVEEGENELETANKELQEEVGYKAGKLEKLGRLTMSPGYLTQKTHVFLGRNLVKSKKIGDEEETPKLIMHPFNQFEELIEKGKITEARVIAALYIAKNFIENEKNKKFVKRKN